MLRHEEEESSSAIRRVGGEQIALGGDLGRACASCCLLMTRCRDLSVFFSCCASCAHRFSRIFLLSHAGFRSTASRFCFSSMGLLYQAGFMGRDSYCEGGCCPVQS